MWPLPCGWGPPPTLQGCPGWSARLSPSIESCPPSVSASQALPPASQRPHTSAPSPTPTSARTNQAQHMRYPPRGCTVHHLLLISEFMLYFIHYLSGATHTGEHQYDVNVSYLAKRLLPAVLGQVNVKKSKETHQMYKKQTKQHKSTNRIFSF